MSTSHFEQNAEPEFGSRRTVEELSPLFPNLELIAFIAQGGMGAVYEARQPLLDRKVALKILSSGPKAFGEVESFRKEARLMAQLNHPNIVGIHDFGQTETGELYFIMEHVNGLPLVNHIYEHSLAPSHAMMLMQQICEGIRYAHAQGVIHHDIKPGNVMLDFDTGRIKILDFGLAGRFSPGHRDEKAAGFGTPQYAAPERFIKGAEIDFRGDIYSLGIVFYEMLAGKRPEGRYTPASKLADVPKEMDAIIDRCLQPDPKDRFANLEGVQIALRNLGRMPTKAFPLKAPVLKAPVPKPLNVPAPKLKSPVAQVVPQQSIFTPAPSSRKPIYVSIGVALGFFVIALVAAMLFS